MIRMRMESTEWLECQLPRCQMTDASSDVELSLCEAEEGNWQQARLERCLLVRSRLREQLFTGKSLGADDGPNRA